MINRFRQWIRGAFSPRVEDSIRLRTLGLACIWLAALGLLWAGGSPLQALAGASLGTVGHGVSWYRRRHRSRVWPLLIATLVIVISFLMRSQMLDAFTGDWVPLGHFLVWVQALSSFDLRTRGGLYASLTLGGIILFFASQQAFDSAFVIFLVGFMTLLLAFLAVAFLEDGVREAQVHWKRQQPGVIAFWVGAACAVFTLSGVAFWLMPRSEDSPLGLSQVAVLPFSEDTLDRVPVIPNVDPQSIPPAPPYNVGAANSGNAGGGPRPGSAGNESPGEIGAGPGAALQGNVVAPGDDSDVVFYVRSKIASYWPGRTLDRFDGRDWQVDPVPEEPKSSRSGPRIRYYRESFGLDNRIRYTQTFFVQKDQPGALFTGYRGLRIFADEGSLEGYGVRQGDSYRVLSAFPRFTPDRLRRDYAGLSDSRYTALPPDSNRLRRLAGRISQGAGSDFDRAARIIAYLGQQATFDSHRPFELTSSASLNEFLFEGKPGSALDYATATTMLARASGLPARLAVGYLPGIRDPLSGSYMVRERDAHAWAEVYFAGHGWVPLDAAPREDISVAGSVGRVGYLFQNELGEKAFNAAKSAPSRLAELAPRLLGNPGVMLGGAFLGMAVLALRWRFTWSGKGRRRDPRPGRLSYSALSGKRRVEVLKLYAQVEKLLYRRGIERRQPWQTVEEYTRLAAPADPAIGEHLRWFTQTVWQAAYNPDRLPSGLIAEGKQRLALLKAALQASDRPKPRPV